MMKKRYSTPKVSVGTVQKSMAAMASRWLCRNISQRLAGSGVLGAHRSQRETVGSDNRIRVLAIRHEYGSSPGWILRRHADDQGRTSWLTPFLPSTCLACESHLQYSRKPARCQATTVLGVTR
jgi:hypothetical protein